ncbi:hypothetical protein GCM10010129_12070 [Streptomyces fumigatiscleroticus]|nr:hypothetical protein GCM10010129_12070 [Streptomyces fumigatiscleroticus]
MLGLLAPALAVALAPVVVSRLRDSPAAPPAANGPEGVDFDEIYRGRHIQGVRTHEKRAVGGGSWHVTVDGRPLHLMRRADGSWLSMVDHYGSYPTPLQAARAAVDELGAGQHLRDTGTAETAGGDHPHPRRRHDVHA